MRPNQGNRLIQGPEDRPLRQQRTKQRLLRRTWPAPARDKAGVRLPHARWRRSQDSEAARPLRAMPGMRQAGAGIMTPSKKALSARTYGAWGQDISERCLAYRRDRKPRLSTFRIVPWCSLARSRLCDWAFALNASAGRFATLTATDKCLAQKNKSSDEGKATNEAKVWHWQHQEAGGRSSKNTACPNSRFEGVCAQRGKAK